MGGGRPRHRRRHCARAGGGRFTGAKGKSCTILAPGGGLSRVVAVGLGKPDALTPRGIEEAAGSAAAALAQDEAAALAADGLTAAQAAAAALGATLARYRFDRYRTKEKPEDKPRLARLTVLADDPGAARAAWAPAQAVAEGVSLARDLVSEPANVLNPAEMARRCQALTRLGLDVEVLGPKELEKLGFGALLGVAQGSANEPRDGGHALARRVGRRAKTPSRPARLHRQGRHLRHRRHQHQARRRHGGHEVGHGRRRPPWSG